MSIQGPGTVSCALASALIILPAAARQDLDAESLRSHMHVVRSIDPLDEDFSDLMPLIEKIGTARVVVLGEATHSEGSTSSAKARLARFLHLRMGFDVLAWESGLAQVHGMNAKLRDPDVPLREAKAYLLAGGWASEEQAHPIFEYARATWRTDRPLEMAAFDSGRAHRGAPYFLGVLSSLFERAPSLAVSDEDWQLVEKLAKRGFGFFSSEQPDEVERARERRVLEVLLARLRAEGPALAALFSERELAFAESFVEHALLCDELKGLSGIDWNTRRDRSMADKVMWLREKVYPGRKIMIWAATSHFISNSDSIRNPDHEDWYTTPWEAGNHLRPLLGDDLYTIAFTAYAGELGDVFPEGSGMESSQRTMTPAPPGSFEFAAHALGESYMFVDLRSAPDDHWLRGVFTSVALGRLENVAAWSQVLDAFMFIDAAEPIRYLPR